MKFCPECGNPVEGYKFCPNCGYSISNQEPTEQSQPVDKPLLQLLPYLFNETISRSNNTRSLFR